MAAEARPARNETICFGEFEVDVSEQTLSHKGARVKLQPQPFQVLYLLIQRAPAIVSREEIRRYVWGDGIHIDATQSINFCIRQIRLALGDTSKESRFIATLPRQGYRFTAPVNGTLAGEPAPIQQFAPNLPKRGRLILTLAVFVSLTALLAGWRWFFPRDTNTGVVRITPITTYPGDEREPSLSPDGRQVAFSWAGENGGNRDIYITALGEEHPVRLTADPAEDSYPSWSPDGASIAFVRRRAATLADIMVMPAIGGPERKLREIHLSSWIVGRLLTWAPDGKWLCFTDEIEKNGHHELFLLSLVSNSVRRLMPEKEIAMGDTSPAFSPDGRWLAFARFYHSKNSKLLLQHLSPGLQPEGAPIEVKNAGINPTSPVWVPNGKRILFVDRTRMMETEIAGSARSQYISPEIFTELSVAGPNQRLVACLRKHGTAVPGEIRSIALEENGLKARGDAHEILPSSGGQTHPRFSPEGRSLAFISSRSGSSEVWVADSDGRNPRQLTHRNFYIAGYPRWSPDGKTLAFHGRLPDQPQIYIVSAETGAIRQVTNGQPGYVAPSWSSDGESLYAIALENGRQYAYRIPVTGGKRELLLEASEAVEAPGCNLLIYGKLNQRGIYGRSLTGDVAKNPERLMASDSQDSPGASFYPVENGFYYLGTTSTGLPRAFRFYQFDTATSVDVAPSPANLNLGLTVSSDRTRLAYSVQAEGDEDLVQIDLR